MIITYAQKIKGEAQKGDAGVAKSAWHQWRHYLRQNIAIGA
jgi:hypothetical protein